MSKSGEVEKHPSYGMLQFSRTTSSHDQPLFGSSIMHRDTIRMSVKPGLVRREHSRDWYYAEGMSYIEVEMSYAQFTEAITAMNMGSGVPVTVRRLNGQGIEEPNFTNKRLEFDKDVQRQMDTIASKMEKITADAEDILNNKKTLTKGDRETILKQLATLRQEVQSNLPFIQNSFNESMDKTVQEAKLEVENFTQSAAMRLGVQSLEALRSALNNSGDSLLAIDEKNDKE